MPVKPFFHHATTLIFPIYHRSSSPAPPAQPLRSRRQHGRLLARIRKKFEVRSQKLHFPQFDIDFLRVADPDRVLDAVAEEEHRLSQSGKTIDAQALRLPYWAELWESAIALGRRLCREAPAQAPRQSVLDLGCGMGLAGTVAARLGNRVVFADLEPDALLFARLNSLPDADRVRFRRLDWRTDRLGTRFDLILGADILYEQAQWQYLEPFWRAHLAPTGRILLGEPGRQTGELFIEWIRARGWRISIQEEPIETRPVPVRIMEVNLR